MRDFLIIFINGVRHEIRADRAFQTLSSFLRYELGLTGTKVVCAEGDCGSCSVLVGRLGGEKIDYQPITSCIQFLYQLDGAHVVTIEGLKRDGKLNAVQQAMVQCQGTQCGFCTPGFVVAMCDHFDKQEKVDDRSLRAALVGNLCRCTGYQSIVEAGLAVNRDDVNTIDNLFPACDFAEESPHRTLEAVMIETDARKFFKPTAISEAVAFKAQHPTCVPIAGATDVGVQVNKQVRDPAIVMSLSAIATLRKIERSGNVLEVGAMATLTDLQLAVESLSPELAKMLWRHGSPLIRNAGTLAGNIANGSPIGDTMPALYVLNGEIELTGPRGSRRANINDFYTGYRKTVMSADELITRVFIPLPKADETLRLYKVSKRHDLDISTFAAAFWMQRSNGVIGDIRIAYGGCGPNIIRLKKTENALIGKPFTENEFEAVAELARSEITPISDVRGSAEYRFFLAENTLRKFFADASGIATYERVTTPMMIATGGNGEAD